MPKTFTLGIVVPTYKEKENITELLTQIKEEVEAHKIKTVVLVMDDNSPDGTADIVRAIIENNKSSFLSIRLHVRPGKMGLGSAYTTGLTMLQPESEYLQEMDADLSHRPQYLHVFLEKAQSGYDAVFGSRYVLGGGIENWGPVRKFISFGGSLYSRAVLGVGISDFTGGYNLYKATVFDTIKLDEIGAEGYLFQIEMKYKTARSGLKYTESPIIFPDRAQGKSKFDKRIFLEAITGVWKLRFGK